MSKAEKFIRDCIRNCSNQCWTEDGISSSMYEPWLTPDQARKAVEIAREEVIEKACRGYCDDMCDKGMCYHKYDGEGQVKNTFKYNECYALQILINSMKDE